MRVREKEAAFAEEAPESTKMPPASHTQSDSFSVLGGMMGCHERPEWSTVAWDPWGHSKPYTGERPCNQGEHWLHGRDQLFTLHRPLFSSWMSPSPDPNRTAEFSRSLANMCSRVHHPDLKRAWIRKYRLQRWLSGWSTCWAQISKFHIKPDAVAYICNSGVPKGKGWGRECFPSPQTSLVYRALNMRLCLKQGRRWRMTFELVLWPLHMYHVMHGPVPPTHTFF